MLLLLGGGVVANVILAKTKGFGGGASLRRSQPASMPANAMPMAQAASRAVGHSASNRAWTRLPAEAEGADRRIGR